MVDIFSGRNTGGWNSFFKSECSCNQSSDGKPSKEFENGLILFIQRKSCCMYFVKGLCQEFDSVQDRLCSVSGKYICLQE